MRNYSRQRETVLNIVRSTTSHPNASWVYEQAKKEIPNISLGTVYRNLSQLVEDGDILCLPVGDSAEHYDGNVKPHLHLSCKKCGMVDDVFCDLSLFEDIANEKDFTCDSTLFTLSGICSKCQNK